MDLKTIELDLLKINEDFINYLDQVYLEIDDYLDNLKAQLQENVTEKSIILKSLEAKLITLDNEYQEKFYAFQNDLENILNEKYQDKYNLENEKITLEQQKEEELKPFFQTIKKQKAEIASKITTLKKELSAIQKENNTKLSEEEKNYKNREIEYTRKLDIDLTRANDANLKQYSELEKNILETEDVKLIKETQKKINEIRILGIKENLDIKNKYAVLNYENTLSYKKLQEKVELDNLVVTEEFKQRIKSLQYELELLDLEEEEKIGLLNLNNELRLSELERDNGLYMCEVEEERLNRYASSKKDYLDLKANENKDKYESLVNVNKEFHEFELSQLKTHLEGNIHQLTLSKPVLENLVNNLKQYYTAFINILLLVYNDYLKQREALVKDLINYFSGTHFENFYGVTVSYSLVKDAINPVIIEYLKAIENEVNKLNNLIKNLVNLLDSQISQTINNIDAFYQDVSNEYQVLHDKLKTNIDSFYLNTSNSLLKNFKSEKTNLQNEEIKDKEEYTKNVNELKEKAKKINEDFNIKKREILKRIELFKESIKVKKEKKKKELETYIKLSKIRIANYKKDYARKIQMHEKVEYKNYKDLVKQNKIEYKNRLSSLDVKK